MKRNEAMRTALSDIAILTTSFFADVDLVVSDILAGLILLVHAPHQISSSSAYVPEIEVFFFNCLKFDFSTTLFFFLIFL